MDDLITQKSMALFEPLGTIKSRSMFGGFGIFADDIMFALVVNDKLHIKLGKSYSLHFEDKNSKPHIYRRRGFPSVTKYHSVPEHLWETPDVIFSVAKKSVEVEKQKKEKLATSKPERLKDLPNLNSSKEKMLNKAGINTVEQLEKEGALHAYKAIQNTFSLNTSLELLWALEGAITGRHWSVIPQSRREELIEDLNY